MVHVPPLSGIDHEEPRRDRAYQDVLIGQGRPGETLRNLLLEVSDVPGAWSELTGHVKALFGVELQRPDYGNGSPYIICEYRPKEGGRSLDIANAGSGFLQVLLLLAFLYAREGAMLLLDEPDAHLHVILQKEIYSLIRQVASSRRSQLLIATHSEVLLDATSPEQVISFVTTPPAPLADKIERDRRREALKRLTTTDLLLASERRSVLYLEDRSDEQILREWARTLNHPATALLERPYVHWLRGNSVTEARSHFFAFGAVGQPVRGLALLDSDDRDGVEGSIAAGREVARWRRYEIENYLLIPRAIAATAAQGPDETLTFDAALTNVQAVFDSEVPAGADLFGSAAALTLAEASTGLLPKALEAAGRPLPKRDFYLVAAAMTEAEIHPEVREKLDVVAAALSAPEAGD